MGTRQSRNSPRKRRRLRRFSARCRRPNPLFDRRNTRRRGNRGRRVPRRARASGRSQRFAPPVRKRDRRARPYLHDVKKVRPPPLADARNDACANRRNRCQRVGYDARRRVSAARRISRRRRRFARSDRDQPGPLRRLAHDGTRLLRLRRRPLRNVDARSAPRLESHPRRRGNRRRRFVFRDF